MNIQLATGNVNDFVGDIIIIPCASELTYSKIGSISKILETGGKALIKELTTVGYCEIGHAVITQGYELMVKHVIFVPIADQNDREYRIDFITLHQSLRAAFILADLYKAKSVAIVGFHIPSKRGNFFKGLWNKYFEGNETKSLRSDEIEDIIISTSKNLENNSIKELVIYKF